MVHKLKLYRGKRARNSRRRLRYQCEPIKGGEAAALVSPGNSTYSRRKGLKALT